MTRTPPTAPPLLPPSARKATRWILVALLMAAMAAITATLVRQLPESSPFSAASPSNSLHREQRESPDNPEGRGAVGEADGVVPDGVTVFDGTVPAVARLDPDLLKALRRAATHAAADGTRFYVNSGWRSPAYQKQLFRKAVATYGSEEEAARWVATTATSPHVSGDAVDIGRSDAAAWLSGHGAAYGLCQIYRNEPWHYELRTDAVEHGCRRMYADPTEDPRMQQ
ncbi:M15 family metallopeptidase [Streptomyces sp. NPDC046465]|uniref:M15 family metallopeptidase n=1 Tax=Streptomyces sp. NPDC046465 TaxID=3155810 RepID=UPI00340E52A8